MSWLYCDPKSRTRTASWATVEGTSSGAGGASTVVIHRPPLCSNAHPDALLALLGLALGLDRRGDDHLRQLEIADRARTAHTHRALERADEVHRAVVDVRGSVEDLVQRPADRGLDARAAGQGGVRRRHAPMAPAPRRLSRAGEHTADHHRVGAAGERLAHVAADAHPAVGDDGDALSAAAQVVV